MVSMETFVFFPPSFVVFQPDPPVPFCFFTMTADHASFILLIFREILVLNQRIAYKTARNFVPPPALIICWRAHPPVECTASTTLPATVSQHTVTSSPSLVLHGPWWCPGLTKIVAGLPSGVLLLTKTLLSTRIPLSGICTAWVWLEWGPYKPTPLTGEQLAATRPMASILQTISAVTSRTLTLSTSLGLVSARRWSSWISVGTLACISPYAFGKWLKATFCARTAVYPAVTSTRGPAQCQVKITLVTMEPSTTSSVAQRGIFPPPSGGLVPICKRQWRAPKGRQNDRKRLSAHKHSFCKLDVGNENVIFERIFNKDWDLQEMSSDCIIELLLVFAFPLWAVLTKKTFNATIL